MHDKYFFTSSVPRPVLRPAPATSPANPYDDSDAVLERLQQELKGLQLMQKEFDARVRGDKKAADMYMKAWKYPTSSPAPVKTVVVAPPPVVTPKAIPQPSRPPIPRSTFQRILPRLPGVLRRFF